MDYLFTSDIIEANPMAAVLRPKAQKSVPMSFDHDAVQRLLQALTQPATETPAPGRNVTSRSSSPHY